MSKKLTLKVTKTAFYKGALVNPGEIIKNYSGDIPTWATLANGDEMPKEDNKNVPPVDDSKVKKDGEGELVTVDETNNESAVQDEKKLLWQVMAEFMKYLLMMPQKKAKLLLNKQKQNSWKNITNFLMKQLIKIFLLRMLTKKQLKNRLQN